MSIRHVENSPLEICVMLGLITFFLTLGSLFNFHIFQFYSFISMFIYLAFSIICLIERRTIRKEAFIILFITIYLLTGSLLYSNGGLGRLSNFLTSLLFIEMCECFSFNKSQLHKLRILAFVAMIYFLFRSFNYASSWVYYRYNDINPNTLGMAILFCAMFFWCVGVELGYPNKRIAAFINVSVFFVSAYSMINLRSRGTLSALFAFAIISAIPKKLLTGKRLYRGTIILVAIGLLVPIVYLVLYKHNYQILLLGKTLYTGRQILWAQMLDALNNSPFNWLFGVNEASTVYSESIDTIHGNTHNDFFVTIYSFGVIAFVFFEVNILRKIKWGIDYIDKGEGSIRYWIYMFICFDIILGYTESVTHWSPLYLFAFFPVGRIAIQRKQIEIGLTEGDKPL